MSVALDSVATKVQTAFPANPFTFDITLVDAGANRRIIVWVLSYNAGSGLPTVSAVTVGGTDSLSEIASTLVTQGLMRAVGWGGTLTVGAGAKTVSITHTAADIMIAYAIAATGTDLVNNGASTGNADRPISLTLTSASGDLTTSATVNDGTPGLTTTQTVRGEGSGSLLSKFDSKTTSTVVNPTHQWTVGGIDWQQSVLAGANFRAASTQSQAPRSMFHFRRRRA